MYLILSLLLMLCPVVLGQVNFIAAWPRTLAAGEWPEQMTLIFTSGSPLVDTSVIEVSVASTSPVAGVTTVFNPATSQPVLVGIYQGTVESSTCTAAATVATPGTLRITLSGTACSVTTDKEVTFFLPWTVLLSNPSEPTTITLRMATFAPNQALREVAVPYTITVPSSRLTSLQFKSLVPSTTVQSVQPSFMVVTFTPGIAVPAPVGDLTAGTIAIAGNAPIFANTPSPAPMFAVGQCVMSTAVTRNVAAGPALSTLIINLLPLGCVLAADETVVFTIPQDYLAANPVGTTQWTRLWTSAEPAPVFVLNPIITGPSTIQQFIGALPSTTATGVTPSELVVSFTLNQALNAGDVVWLGTIPGVFKRQVSSATVSSPNAACANVLVTTNVTNSAEMDTMTFIMDASCAAVATAGATLTFNIPAVLLLPNPPAGTVVPFDIRTNEDTAMLQNQYGYTTTAECGPGSVLSVTDSGPNSFMSMGPASQMGLVNAMLSISPTTAGVLACTATSPNTWFFKVAESAWPQTVTSPGAPTVFITNWGYLYTEPILAIVKTYPPTVSSLEALKIGTSIPEGHNLEFLVKIERIMDTGRPVYQPDPLQFEVTTDSHEIAELLLFTTPYAPGAPLQGTMGMWAHNEAANTHMIRSNYDGVFVGYSHESPAPSPPHVEDGSDDALFGLLALIAIPLVCFCLCALLAFRLRPKKADPFMCPCPCPSFAAPAAAGQDYMPACPQPYPAPYPPPYW